MPLRYHQDNPTHTLWVYLSASARQLAFSAPRQSGCRLPARWCAHRRCCFFGEATSALDARAKEQITALSSILHVQTIFIQEKGRIVGSGNHTERLGRHGLHYSIWRQLKPVQASADLPLAR